MPSSYDEVVVRSIAIIAAVVITASACAPAPSIPSSAPTSGSSATPTGSAPATVLEGLADRPVAKGAIARRWYTTSDGLFADAARVSIAFPNVDAAPGRPRARLRSTGRSVDLTLSGGQWTGTLPLDGAPPGAQTVDFLIRLRDGTD
ncbi:MAG: hypothetical protein E6J35_07380, partial [Chloroflexi bacterium]